MFPYIYDLPFSFITIRANGREVSIASTTEICKPANEISEHGVEEMSSYSSNSSFCKESFVFCSRLLGG